MKAKKYAFKCHREETPEGTIVYPVNALAYHPTHGTFASGGSDGLAIIWDGENKKRLLKLRKFPTSISGLSFNHRGMLLAVASSYMYEKGVIDVPRPTIVIRHLEESDVMPKSKR